MNRIELFSRKIFPRFFLSHADVMLDFGSGQARFYLGEKLILAKPSRVVVDKRSGRSLEAKNKNTYPSSVGDFSIKYLVDQGAITDFDLASSFLNSFLQKSFAQGIGLGSTYVARHFGAGFNSLFVQTMRGKKFFLLPSSATPTEKLIAEKILANLNYGKWTLVTKKDCVKSSVGCVIDVGFDLTEVIVGIGQNQTVAKTIKFGSQIFTKKIKTIIRDKYQLDISWAGAQKVKLELRGNNFLTVNLQSAFPAPVPANQQLTQKIGVRGKDINAFIPRTAVIEASVLSQALLEQVDELLDEIKLFFGQIQTDVLLNSLEKGIDLWGGGGNLAGLESYFAQKLQTNVTSGEASYVGYEK